MFNAYKLKKRKQSGLFEIKQDIKFIEAFKSKPLKYDEKKARQAFSVLKRKEDRNEKEEAEMSVLEDMITESRAVKAEHEKLKSLEVELAQYISLL